MSDPQFSTYGSEQQWIPYLTTADGVISNFAFDKFSGGEATAAVQKFRPAGMGPELTYTALPVYSDVKITKAFNGLTDYNAQAAIRGDVGTTGATVTVVPLNDQGQSGWAPNRVYTGRLSAISDGDTDSTSGAVRMWEVTLVVENVVN